MVTERDRERMSQSVRERFEESKKGEENRV